MRQERILVTGATGFVGRHLVEHFRSAGRLLTLAVRNADACPPSWQADERIRIVATGPIETATNLGEALAGVATVVHLAGLAHVRGSGRGDDPFAAANATATERLAQAAADGGIGSFIHLSSLAAITRNASPSVIDDTTRDPAPTPYGRSKREAEKHVLALAEHGVFAVSLRPPLVVGAEAKGNWGALQRLAATGLPLPFARVRNRRSLIGIRTLVEVLDRLCTGLWPPEKSGNYCIADAESLSLPAIVTELRRGMGLPPRLFPCSPGVLKALAAAANRQQMAAGLLGDLRVDAGRFQATFDFTPTQDLAASIAQSGMCYRRPASAGPGGNVE